MPGHLQVLSSLKEMPPGFKVKVPHIGGDIMFIHELLENFCLFHSEFIQFA